MLVNAVVDRIKRANTIVGNNVISALSPADLRNKSANFVYPLLVVINKSEEVIPKTDPNPSPDYSGAIILYESRITVMFVDTPSKELNSGTIARMRSVRNGLISALYNWSPEKDGLAITYSGYSVKEDNSGAAWVDFEFCAYEAVSDDCFSLYDDLNVVGSALIGINGVGKVANGHKDSSC